MTSIRAQQMSALGLTALLIGGPAQAGKLQIPEGSVFTVGPGGIAVDVPEPPPPPPVVTLSADPSLITAGQASNLSVNSGNAVSCAGWGGPQPTNGTVAVSPLVTTLYRIDCTGLDGISVASAEALVTVAIPPPPPPAPTLSLNAVPSAITAGQTSSLSWAGTNLDKCAASWDGVEPVSGSAVVSPSLNTTYTLACKGLDGSDISGSAVVTVAAPPPPTPAQVAEAIGMGCTTAYFIDKDCDGHGVGVKSDSAYRLDGVVVDIPGDMPDADDMDPDVNTTETWQAKWGTDNAGMVRFLQERKGFHNTSRIFYVALDGDDATAVINDPGHPFKTGGAVERLVRDRQGGAIIYRGGDWGTKKLLYGGVAPTGSPGHPLYVMVYPGERVITSNTIGGGGTPGDAIGDITWDEFTFRSGTLTLGDPVSYNDSSRVGLINNDFIGWHQVFFGNHTRDVIIEQNLFRQFAAHSVYFAQATPLGADPPLDANGDTDFDAAEKLYRKRLVGGGGPSFRGKMRNNVSYNSGASGYDPFHLNAYMTGMLIDGNIITYSGGASIGLQTGVYDATMTNNVIFDNGRDSITPVLASVQATTMKRNKLINNTILVGPGTDGIRGANPSHGVNIGTTPGLVKPGPHWHKDYTIDNNIIATNIGTGRFPFVFGNASYPDTYDIATNILWDSNPNAAPLPNKVVMKVSPTAGGGIAGGNYSASQLQSLSPRFTGNIFADPKFTSASYGFTKTPGKFNLRPLAGSPAIDAGMLDGAPKTDVRGLLRDDGKPDIGAYEYYAGTSAIPLATLFASSRGVIEGQSTVLTWISLNAKSCAGVGFDTGGKAAGSVTVAPQTHTVYGLTCDGDEAKTAAQDVEVRVSPVADLPVVTIQGPNAPIKVGQSATIKVTANSSIFYNCLWNHASFPIRDKVGPGAFSFSVAPKISTTYDVACYNSYGDTNYATVEVRVDPNLPAAPSSLGRRVSP